MTPLCRMETPFFFLGAARLCSRTARRHRQPQTTDSCATRRTQQLCAGVTEWRTMEFKSAIIVDLSSGGHLIYSSGGGNSAQMQLGRWDFAEASMVADSRGYKVAIATHLSSSARLWSLTSFSVLCIADLPRTINIFRTPYIFISTINRAVPTVLSQCSMGDCRTETNEGMKNCQEQPTKNRRQKLRHSLSAPLLLCGINMAENDCPEASTNHTLVLDALIVHGPPEDANPPPLPIDVFCSSSYTW